MPTDHEFPVEDTSLIHIGLPKTASTALQRHFFPYLGLPFRPFDEGLASKWYKTIRYADEYVAPPYEGRQIVSGESLCDPGNFGCAEVARRLHKTFKEAIVLV